MSLSYTISEILATALWAWRPLFHVSRFFATFPERSMFRPRRTTGLFRKELKNAPNKCDKCVLKVRTHVLCQVSNFNPRFTKLRTQHTDNASRVHSIRRSFSGKPATAQTVCQV